MVKRRVSPSLKKLEASQKHSNKGSIKDLLLIGAMFLGGLWGFYQQSNLSDKTAESRQSTGIERKVGKITLDDVRRNPLNRELGQKYLDQIINFKDIKYCDGVVYDPTGELYFNSFIKKIDETDAVPEWKDMHKKALMSAHNNGDYSAMSQIVPVWIGTGKRNKIYVGRSLFPQEVTSDEDVIFVLKVHEARHLKQFYEGLSFVNNNDFLRSAAANGELSKEVLFSASEVDASVHSLRTVYRGIIKPSQHCLGRELTHLAENMGLLEKNLTSFNGINYELANNVLSNAYTVQSRQRFK